MVLVRLLYCTVLLNSLIREEEKVFFFSVYFFGKLVNRCGVPTCGIQQDTQHYTVYIHTNRGIYHPLFIINSAHSRSYISKKEGPERRG